MMGSFTSLFNVFSRRQSKSKPLESQKPLTFEFRNRVLLYCVEIFKDNRHCSLEEFAQQIRSKLQYLLGRPGLSRTDPNRLKAYTEIEDLFNYLKSCEDMYFLDFIELFFKVDCFWSLSDDEVTIVNSINEFFLVDDLPYSLTPVIRETVEHVSEPRHTYIRISEYPCVIRKDDQLIHQHIIEPVIDLLSDQSFNSANHEFLEALKDYRKGNFGDCLTKCNSSFESVMKIICSKKRWNYNQHDSASRLIEIILENTRLEPFFRQYFIHIATMRNKLSKSHGAGIKKINVTPHVAKYAINTTASAIILIYDETLKKS